MAVVAGSRSSTGVNAAAFHDFARRGRGAAAGRRRLFRVPPRLLRNYALSRRTTFVGCGQSACFVGFLGLQGTLRKRVSSSTDTADEKARLSPSVYIRKNCRSAFSSTPGPFQSRESRGLNGIRWSGGRNRGGFRSAGGKKPTIARPVRLRVADEPPGG